MAKRRISKASKRRLTIFGTLSIVAILYFIFSLLYNIYVIYDLTIDKKNLDEKYVQLQEEAEELKIDIGKLNDPKYLEDYARETYGYSKGGEYVIKFGEEVQETNQTLDVISMKINRNYTILGLSSFMVIIFIYIILKDKKKKSKKK